MIFPFFAKGIILAGLSSMSMVVAATGIKTDIALLVVNTDDAGGQVNIQNTGSLPIMLLTRISPCGDGRTPLFSIMPPLVHIDENKTQRIRFTFIGNRNIHTQRLVFANLEAFPVGHEGSHSVRQSLPIIVNPQGVALKSDPWTLLQWSMVNEQLTVHNSSPYVIRLSKEIETLPGRDEWQLSQSYLLPDERLVLTAKKKLLTGKVTQVVLHPMSNEGNTMGRYTATLDK
ncbi:MULTISPECIES: fimbria/pilus periplasmic chaperone [Enterobacter]|uniref:fimbria/pilus periplasmic chaperone n=1 Tax=Enterobacter TaxID=547 RepID=UPI001F1F5E50|nr:fimbria/pilus periplasmic chaperone [Enterobacter quasiroggenkampii]